MKRRKPDQEKSIRRQAQSFHSSSEAETFPKRDQSKSEKPKILQKQIKRQKRKAGNADESEEKRAQRDGDFENFKSDGAESSKRTVESRKANLLQKAGGANG